MRQTKCAVAMHGEVLHALQLLSEQRAACRWNVSVMLCASVHHSSKQRQMHASSANRATTAKHQLWPAAGQDIQGKRDRFIVATKFGYVMRDGEHRSLSAHGTVRGHAVMLSPDGQCTPLPLKCADTGLDKACLPPYQAPACTITPCRQAAGGWLPPACSSSLRGLPGAPGHSPDRPVLPASCGPHTPHRGDLAGAEGLCCSWGCCRQGCTVPYSAAVRAPSCCATWHTQLGGRIAVCVHAAACAEEEGWGLSCPSVLPSILQPVVQCWPFAVVYAAICIKGQDWAVCCCMAAGHLGCFIQWTGVAISGPLTILLQRLLPVKQLSADSC